MENIIKGYVTSLLGLIIIVLVIIHFFGIYDFPNPTSLSNNQESGIALFIGLFLFLVPSSKIEVWIEKIVGKKTDGL